MGAASPIGDASRTNSPSRTDREPVRLLVFSGSLRAGSHNTRLAALAARAITAQGGQADLASLADFDSPSYNQDLEASSGIPAPVHAFHQRLLAADGFVMVSPEYNASMPAALKNLIDWASRFRPQPFSGRHGLLMSASPSLVGGNRGLWALRIPLEHLGARVYPDMFSLAAAHQALSEDGQLSDAALRARFQETISSFLDLVEAAKHYPCAKHAWVEFLGERPDPVIDRVELVETP
jgi:chromate reductase, NAD(P)H dehydrogenase (quinone)